MCHRGDGESPFYFFGCCSSTPNDCAKAMLLFRDGGRDVMTRQHIYNSKLSYRVVDFGSYFGLFDKSVPHIILNSQCYEIDLNICMELG